MQVWQLGTPIILLGFPQYRRDEVNGDLNLSMMDGKIQNQGGRQTGEVTVNVNNTSGSSGGPVLNVGNGKVVGVFSKSEQINTSTGYFVDANTWREMVQGQVQAEFQDYIALWAASQV